MWVQLKWLMHSANAIHCGAEAPFEQVPSRHLAPFCQDGPIIVETTICQNCIRFHITYEIVYDIVYNIVYDIGQFRIKEHDIAYDIAYDIEYDTHCMQVKSGFIS